MARLFMHTAQHQLAQPPSSLHTDWCCSLLSLSSADPRSNKRKSAEPDPKARQRMQSMFKKAPVRVAPRNAATEQSSDDLLNDILGNLGGESK